MKSFDQWLEGIGLLQIAKTGLGTVMRLQACEQNRTITVDGKGENFQSALGNATRKLNKKDKKEIQRVELLNKDGKTHTFRIWLGGDEL